MNWLPPPNADPFHNVSGYNYIQPVVVTQNGPILHARLDYTINDRNSLYAAYGRQSQITDQPVNLNYIPSNSVLYPGGVTTGDISNIGSITYTHTFNSSLTNELTGATVLYQRSRQHGQSGCGFALHHERLQRRQRELQLPGRVQERRRLLGAGAAGLQQPRISECADARRLLQQPDSCEEGRARCAGGPELDQGSAFLPVRFLLRRRNDQRDGTRRLPAGPVHRSIRATHSTSTTAIRRDRSQTRSSSPARIRSPRERAAPRERRIWARASTRSR